MLRVTCYVLRVYEFSCVPVYLCTCVPVYLCTCVHVYLVSRPRAWQVSPFRFRVRARADLTCLTRAVINQNDCVDARHDDRTYAETCQVLGGVRVYLCTCLPVYLISHRASGRFPCFDSASARRRVPHGDGIARANIRSPCGLALSVFTCVRVYLST